MRSNAFDSKLPPGDDWMSLDVGLVESGEAGATSGGADLKSQLNQLRSIGGHVETVGPAEIGGTKTTRYRATYDLGEYASYLRRQGSDQAAQDYEQIERKIPMKNKVEVWVDRRGLLRRTRMKIDYLNAKPGQMGAMDMTIDYSDFGVAPDIQPPDPNTVFDATPLIRKALGLDG
jgi:hypothetical protein